MKKFILPERGVTLVELLVTLALISLFGTIMYSVFLTGIKLYQKIEVEGQLREDADYIATAILNEMYSNSPKSVKIFKDPITGNEGIILIRANEKKVDGYLIEDNTTQPEKTIKIYFDGKRFIIESKTGNAQDMKTVEIESKFATINKNQPNEIKSKVTLSNLGNCNSSYTECSHGTIQLTLALEGENEIKNSLINSKPLVLESSFGF